MSSSARASGRDDLGSIPDALRALLQLLTREPLMLASVIAAFALTAISAVVLLVHGDLIGEEGHVQKAMSFNFAVGLYLVTLTILLPLARMSKKVHGRWVVAHAVALIPFFGIENVQVYRGIDPRFTEVGSMVDTVVGILFGVVAGIVIALFLVVVVRFFRQPTDQRDRLLLLGARYGSVATLAAFAVGIGMSVLSGSTVGDDGNLLPAHAVGFHGMQAVPLVAWLMLRAAPDRAAMQVHLAGLLWVIATFAVCAHAVVGEAPFSVTPANGIAGIALVAWMAVAVDAFRHRFSLPTTPTGRPA